jgi:hypothetical protein
MGITVADYIVLLDGDFLLETERIRSKFFKFALTDDFFADALITRPVLTYRVRVPGKDTRLHVHVNPPQQGNSSTGTSSGFPVTPDSFYTLPSGYFGQLNAVFTGSKFKKGQENTIAFTISGDGNKFGDIEIGNVVLFVQRDIRA